MYNVYPFEVYFLKCDTKTKFAQLRPNSKFVPTALLFRLDVPTSKRRRRYIESNGNPYRTCCECYDWFTYLLKPARRVLRRHNRR